MGLFHLRAKERLIEHLSIGNVELRILRPEPVHTISFNGTVGMRMESHHSVQYPCLPGDRLVLFSDGISGRFDIPPQILSRTAIEVASYIFNNHRRAHDDATVLVLG